VNTAAHDGAVTAHINVTNTGSENGTVGLHVHYWSGNCSRDGGTLLHSHKPSTHLEAGETGQVQDTYSSGDPDEVDCVSAHVHS